MKTPLQIHFHNCPSSSFVESRIEELVSGLERYSDLTHCAVHIERPHQHKQSHRGWEVHVHAALPHRAPAVVHKATPEGGDDNLYVLVANAVTALDRQLQKLTDKERGWVKTHADASLHPDAPAEDAGVEELEGPRPPSIYDLLLEHPFTAKWPEADRDRLEQIAELTEMTAGQHLMTRGLPAEAFFMIVSGRVAVSRPDLEILDAGDVAGWSWLLSAEEAAFDVVALEPTTTLQFSADALNRLLEDEPELGFRFARGLLSVLASRLKSNRDRVLELV